MKVMNLDFLYWHFSQPAPLRHMYSSALVEDSEAIGDVHTGHRYDPYKRLSRAMAGYSDRPRLPSGLRLAKSSDAPGILSWNDLKERLWLVTESGNAEEMKLYWEMLPDTPRALSVDSFVNGSDETCLHIAVRKGHVACIGYLLQRNANVNVTGRKGIAAVHLAAIEGHLDVLEMLVKVGGSLSVCLTVEKDTTL